MAQRDHALLNDNACEKLRKPITVDDYINSRMIADPIRLLDSVMVCDGGSGLLVTTRKRAKQKGIEQVRRADRLSASAPTSAPPRTSSMSPKAATRSPASARFAMAGIGPRDVASFHPYDDFIIAIMLQLEMLGFCKHGQGCDFIKETDFTHTGDLPLNTGGGQISAGQAGLAGGGTNLIEAVRQLFGEGGKRQVRNTKNAVVTGIGGIPYGRNWATSVVMILSPDA